MQTVNTVKAVEYLRSLASHSGSLSINRGYVGAWYEETKS